MYSGIIYRATGPTGKKYYGKTVRSLEVRKSEHLRNKRNWKFSNALKKYGIENFNWEIIETYKSDIIIDLTNKLNERETYWIKKDNTTEIGYNMTSGGDGTFGFKRTFSEEHKEKIRQALLGKKLSEEHKEKLSNIGKGKKRSDETKRKISRSKKGIHFSKEHKEHIRESKTGKNNPNCGKKRSKETIEKIRQSNLGQKRSEETCLKIGKIHKGKIISDEHKEKIKAFHTGRKRSPETCEKLRLKALEREAKKRKERNETKGN
jgi:group I intron endonuclease